MSDLNQRRWLKRICEINFYESNNVCCNHLHVHRTKTRFCVTCVHGPICQTSVNESHARHQVLQVNRLNGQEVVRVSHMQKLGIDVGTIERYKCAWRDCVHLRARANKTLRDCPKCERCQADIMGSSNMFCSIACKLNLDLEADGPSQQIYSPSGPSQQIYSPSGPSNQVFSPRRHARKGTPIRSPLM